MCQHKNRVIVQNYIHACMQVISGDLSGPVLNYTVAYSSGGITATSQINIAESGSCAGPICNYTVEVPSSVCSSSTVNVNISARNMIGRGFSTDTVSLSKYIQCSLF